MITVVCRYADKTNMELGLLFTCRLGNVDLDRPVGLLQKKDEVGTQTTMEATLMAQQSPGQREQVGFPLVQSIHCILSIEITPSQVNDFLVRLLQSLQFFAPSGKIRG